MGCAHSNEEIDSSVTLGAPGSTPIASKNLKTVVPHLQDDDCEPTREDPKAARPTVEDTPPARPAKRATTPAGDKRAGLPAEQALKAEPAKPSAPQRRVFPLPDGWVVNCRLSPGDVRSRWGSRPRPAALALSPRGYDGSAAMAFEADVVVPGPSTPLRLSLQMLPQWTEPVMGSHFIGRYEVKKSLPSRARCGGQRFEVFDRQEQIECVLQACNLASEADVKLFVERLQLETLDTESKLFLRIRDVALSLPSRLAVIEDIPRQTLWEEFDRADPGAYLVDRVVSVASAVLNGLSRLHSAGWAHCGVSPDTICLALDGRWKLTGLECAQTVQRLAQDFSVVAFSTAPPEALLGLPVTEKVDVWGLATALCEAVTRKRVGTLDGSYSAAERLCALVDFLGPLPSRLVDQHPEREELFTPDGLVLRPATPDAFGVQALEAVEPPPAQEGGSRGDPALPRPRLVVEEISGVEGEERILNFLGQLLNPDPAKRPSSAEALALDFLQSHERSPCVRISDQRKDTSNSIQRRGTGFVQISELPNTDSEDEDDSDAERAMPTKRGASKEEHVTINDAHGDNENGITRKGTGFVSVCDIPSSDSEDSDNDAAAVQPRHVHIQGADPKNQDRKPMRRGTGFVLASELRTLELDEEEEEESHQQQKAIPKRPRVQVQDSHGAGRRQMVRKCTGFVQLAELPPTDFEEDEVVERPSDLVPDKRRVRLSDTKENEPEKNHLLRNGTGFVQVKELPPSDESESEEEKEKARAIPKNRVRIQISSEDKENRIQRKGTGFILASELSLSDDEEEAEEEVAHDPKMTGNVVALIGKEEDPHVVIVKKACVSMEEDAISHESVSRKGTGFISLSKLSDKFGEDSDDEDEEQAKDSPRVRFAEAKSGKEDHKRVRTGTGFVLAAELAGLEVEDEDEDEDERVLNAEAGVQENRSKVQFEEAKSGKRDSNQRRTGTGFLHASELAGLGDEDEDEESTAESAAEEPGGKVAFGQPGHQQRREG